METLNDKKEMQKVIISFKARALMEFPISQDISNLTKEELAELLQNVYEFLEITVEKCQKLNR